MMLSRHPGNWIIVWSFVIAFLLTIIPLPEGVGHFWPDWLCLVLVYWCMALPQRVGIGIGWLAGLCLDATKGIMLGQHALGLAVVAFLTLKTHRQIRVFPLWQQSLGVFIFLLVNQVLMSWINAMVGYPTQDFWYLAPALGGMLSWPGVFIILRDLRRHFRIA